MRDLLLRLKNENQLIDTKKVYRVWVVGMSAVEMPYKQSGSEVELR